MFRTTRPFIHILNRASFFHSSNFTKINQPCKSYINNYVTLCNQSRSACSNSTIFMSPQEKMTLKYTTAIKQLIFSAQPTEALALYYEMEKNSLIPSSVTTILIIRALIGGGKMEEAVSLTNHMLQNQRTVSPEIYYDIIRGYVKDNKIAEGVKILHEKIVKQKFPSEIGYSVFIDNFIANKKYEEILDFMEDLARSQIYGNEGIFVKLIYYFLENNLPHYANSVLEHAKKQNIRIREEHFYPIFEQLLSQNFLSLASPLFDRLKLYRNADLYIAMADAYFHNQRYDKLKKLVVEMKENKIPIPVELYAKVYVSHLDCNQIGSAKSYFQLIPTALRTPMLLAEIIQLSSACWRKRNFTAIANLAKDMDLCPPDADLNCFNRFIYLHGLLGDKAKMDEIFSSILRFNFTPTTDTFNSFLPFSPAPLSLFDSFMQKYSVLPNERTIALLYEHHLKFPSNTDADQIRKLMNDHNVPVTYKILDLIIQTHIKHGDPSKAKGINNKMIDLFNNRPCRELLHSIIRYYSLIGNHKKVFQYFQMMKNMKIAANRETLSLLLPVSQSSIQAQELYFRLVKQERVVPDHEVFLRLVKVCLKYNQPGLAQHYLQESFKWKIESSKEVCDLIYHCLKEVDSPGEANIYKKLMNLDKMVAVDEESALCYKQ